MSTRRIAKRIMMLYCKNSGCGQQEYFCRCPKFYTGLTTAEKLAVAVEHLEEISSLSNSDTDESVFQIWDVAQRGLKRINKGKDNG